MRIFVQLKNKVLEIEKLIEENTKRKKNCEKLNELINEEIENTNEVEKLKNLMVYIKS